MKTDRAVPEPTPYTAPVQEMSLYVHVPFCISRCYYCDFVSTAGLPRAMQERYRTALGKELALYTDGGPVRSSEPIRWKSLYFGGGTPTCLDEDILAGLFADIRRGGNPGSTPSEQAQREQEAEATQVTQAISSGAEFTVEANPGTLTPGKLAVLRQAGCNRLSVGAQSFDDRYLRFLGRSHRAEDFYTAWEAARAAGFTNMSLDLLYGLPGQSPAHWEDTLREALAFKPEHISLYQLGIEAGTELARRRDAGRFDEADEEDCRTMYLLTHRILTDAGYLHYEISNFALPGYESRHNTHYWQNGFYLGLGAGAAGYLPGFRYTNKADLEAYIADAEKGTLPVGEEDPIDARLAIAEELMLAFRLREGPDPAAFHSRHGFDFRHQYGHLLEEHLDAGLLEEEDGRIRPTVEGWLAYNSWITDYMG